ncbi:MAG: TIGR03619 family F420-dependent LLM class oxidoreductase, partial [Acidimicrobiales bacterium]
AVKGDDGALDLEQTMEPVPKLHRAGVTDFRIAVKPPRGEQAAVEYLSPVVTAFRARAEGWT